MEACREARKQAVVQVARGWPPRSGPGSPRRCRKSARASGPRPAAAPAAASAQFHGPRAGRPQRPYEIPERHARDCKRIPPRPPAAVESAHALLDPSDAVRRQTLGLHRRRARFWRVGTMLWSLSAGLWTVWRGLLVLGGRGACDRRRRHVANAPGLSRQQQVAARRSALIRTAVIGVGYLGRFHAQKYASLPNSQLAGHRRPFREGARRRWRRNSRSRPMPTIANCLGHVDAVSIVTPTASHFEVAKAFLEAGASVLVEKPMTVTVAEGRSLIEIARAPTRILQVGHLERFNAAVRAVQPTLTVPRFIESARLAPFKYRGTDVDVVLDLDDSRHRFDLEYRALARGGGRCDRHQRIFQRGRYRQCAPALRQRLRRQCNRQPREPENRTQAASVPGRRVYLGRSAAKDPDRDPQGRRASARTACPRSPSTRTPTNRAMRSKRRSKPFLDAVATGQPPPVTGEDGLVALRTAVSIGEQVASSRQSFPEAGPPRRAGTLVRGRRSRHGPRSSGRRRRLPPALPPAAVGASPVPASLSVMVTLSTK